MNDLPMGIPKFKTITERTIEAIQEAGSLTGWSFTKMAPMLGVSRSTAYRLCRVNKIEIGRKRRVLVHKQPENCINIHENDLKVGVMNGK